MIDIKLIRKDSDAIEKKLQTKDKEISLKPLLTIDEKIRTYQKEGEDLKAKRNRISKEIGQKKLEKEPKEKLLNEASQIADQISKIDQEVRLLEEKKEEIIYSLPNIPFDEIPISSDPQDNVCIKTFGEKRAFSFPFKNHLELNKDLKLFDFPRSAKMTGTGFVTYTDLGARLEWALLNYMLDIHKKNGFHFIIPPLLVKPEIMFGSGQLPKFEEQLYKIQDADYHLYLIPSAEVVLNGLHYEEIFDLDQLPQKTVSYTPCFRREAGAAGKQERGLIRMHQFNKVELFSFCTPDQSDLIFEQMLASAEEVLQRLHLHYRNMLLVTGDTSFAAAKTVDIETWLPGQNRYYEVSSVSNCTDFQARRSKIRFQKKGEKPQFVHTLNGSGVATSRLMVALLENNQQEDGTVIIPEALHHYLEEEITHIKPQK